PRIVSQAGRDEAQALRHLRTVVQHDLNGPPGSISGVRDAPALLNPLRPRITGRSHVATQPGIGRAQPRGEKIPHVWRGVVPQLVDADPLELLALELMHVLVAVAAGEDHLRAGREAPLVARTLVELRSRADRRIQP